MPVSEIRKLNEQTFIGFWPVTETIPELETQFRKLRSSQQIPDYKSEVRTKEWLASRILVYQLLPEFTTEKLTLYSNENGKPFFSDNNLHVFISQSAGLVAVIISSKYEVGIDIEMIKAKALRVAFKFLSDKELTYIENNEIKACLYWSAKETLFKMYSRKQLLFKENLALGPFTESEKGTLTGQVITANFNRTYTVHYEKNAGFILTYCLA